MTEIDSDGKRHALERIGIKRTRLASRRQTLKSVEIGFLHRFLRRKRGRGRILKSRATPRGSSPKAMRFAHPWVRSPSAQNCRQEINEGLSPYEAASFRVNANAKRLCACGRILRIGGRRW